MFQLLAGNASHNLSLESKEGVGGRAEVWGSHMFFTGGREGRLVVANKVRREDYIIECQLTGNEGEGVTSQVPVLNVEKPNFSTVFFFQGCTQFILEVLIILRQKKRGKIEFLRR